MLFAIVMVIFGESTMELKSGIRDKTPGFKGLYDKEEDDWARKCAKEKPPEKTTAMKFGLFECGKPWDEHYKSWKTCIPIGSPNTFSITCPECSKSLRINVDDLYVPKYNDEHGFRLKHPGHGLKTRPLGYAAIVNGKIVEDLDHDKPYGPIAIRKEATPEHKAGIILLIVMLIVAGAVFIFD